MQTQIIRESLRFIQMNESKSTLVRQIKIINQTNQTKDEFAQYRINVYEDLVDSAQVIVYAMRKLRLEPRNSIFSEKILDYYVESDPSFQLSSEIVEAIDSVWHDPIISEVMEKQNHFYLMDFLASVRRIGAPGYFPEKSDVFRTRTKTTDVSETRFNMRQLSIHVGCRFERKKWIHHFEAVTSIIFIVPLNEYDQVFFVRFEPGILNRLAERLILFESIINSRWFLRTSIILLLTKIDLFRTKLLRVPLEQYFPGYSGT
ncbi:6492_t:CDS:2 [Diversispora eburnea]|uniref:6492_t:CDS:1 n=1 Tax=Diversispora eburnea TaxID=1213867 RepID=A0A9N8V1G6_9GLOM|nr:6492_t:CDS:2 [Diversispora eburnea]